jgi:hypothetical protein
MCSQLHAYLFNRRQGLEGYKSHSVQGNKEENVAFVENQTQTLTRHFTNSSVLTCGMIEI